MFNLSFCMGGSIIPNYTTWDDFFPVGGNQSDPHFTITCGNNFTISRAPDGWWDITIPAEYLSMNDVKNAMRIILGYKPRIIEGCINSYCG
jgi:hypothetical protein